MEDVKVTMPIVNLNGNGKQSLMDMLEKAYDAVRAAYEAVAETSDIAHGRNHFDMEKAREARDQHIARLQKLHDVQKELEALAIGISRQGR